MHRYGGSVEYVRLYGRVMDAAGDFHSARSACHAGEVIVAIIATAAAPAVLVIDRAWLFTWARTRAQFEQFAIVPERPYLRLVHTEEI